MSNKSNSGETNNDGTAAAIVAKRTRESRNNHAVAKQYPITDADTAQIFADEAFAATVNDKASTMYNGSGFVTPYTLTRQDVENRLRLAVTIIFSLAESIGPNDQSASRSLDIISTYASTAGVQRKQTMNARILAQADAIRAEQSDKASR